jgi:hypothetical protein
MNATTLGEWLADGTLSQLSKQGACDQSIWAQRYDATCPSAFYRGYATVLVRVGDEFRSNPDLVALGRLTDSLDLAIKSLAADERRNGASFALMNITSYARVGRAPQVSATLSAELTCIARCFVENQARGL